MTARNRIGRPMPNPSIRERDPLSCGATPEGCGGADHDSLFVRIGGPVAMVIAPSAVSGDDTDAIACIGRGTVLVTAGATLVAVGAFLWSRS